MDHYLEYIITIPLSNWKIFFTSLLTNMEVVATLKCMSFNHLVCWCLSVIWNLHCCLCLHFKAQGYLRDQNCRCKSIKLKDTQWAWCMIRHTLMVKSPVVWTMLRVTLAMPLAPVTPGLGWMSLLDGTSTSTFTFSAGLLSGLVTLTWHQKKHLNRTFFLRMFELHLVYETKLISLLGTMLAAQIIHI